MALTVGLATANSTSKLGKGEKESDSTYPQSTDVTFLYVNPKKGFQGGQLKLDNGSTFKFGSGSLTPPSGWQLDRITLTMVVDIDTTRNQLLFTFGPSGCQFDPPAETWFDWSDLGISNPKLYYIDADGNRIEQQPNHIDFRGNKILLYIDHFSRYALGVDN